MNPILVGVIPIAAAAGGIAGWAAWPAAQTYLPERSARRRRVAAAGICAVGGAALALPMTRAGAPGAAGVGAADMLVLAAQLVFLVAGVLLAAVDLAVHRLPRPIVLTAGAVCGALLVSACVAGLPWSGLGRAVAGAVALYLFYALLRALSRRGMGGGDVRLAAVVGLMLGWSGWMHLVVGAFAAFVLGGVFALALVLTGRAGRSTAVPFGPWMLAGAWVGLLAAPALGEASVLLPV